MSTARLGGRSPQQLGGAHEVDGRGAHLGDDLGQDEIGLALEAVARQARGGQRVTARICGARRIVVRVTEPLDGEGELADGLGDPVRRAQALRVYRRAWRARTRVLRTAKSTVLVRPHVARDCVPRTPGGPGTMRTVSCAVANASTSSSTPPSSPRAVRSARPARPGSPARQRGGDLAERRTEVAEDARRRAAARGARVGRENERTDRERDARRR